LPRLGKGGLLFFDKVFSKGRNFQSFSTPGSRDLNGGSLTKCRWGNAPVSRASPFGGGGRSRCSPQEAQKKKTLEETQTKRWAASSRCGRAILPPLGGGGGEPGFRSAFNNRGPGFHPRSSPAFWAGGVLVIQKWRCSEIIPPPAAASNGARAIGTGPKYPRCI